MSVKKIHIFTPKDKVACAANLIEYMSDALQSVGYPFNESIVSVNELDSPDSADVYLSVDGRAAWGNLAQDLADAAANLFSVPVATASIGNHLGGHDLGRGEVK